MGIALGLGAAGCGSLQMQETGAAPGSPLATAGGIQGNVHGGQQGVVGATIQLYSAGLTGYGSNATPLLPVTGAGVVKTDQYGYFSLPAYTCPSNSYVYITATGGNPQVGGTVNANIALMAPLGACTSLTPTTFVTINEITTVAGIYALQQFTKITAGTGLGTAPGNASGSATPGFSIGTSAGNLQGLINAFGTANVLANMTTGTTPGANTSNTQLLVEVWQIDTIADILASCVNSNPTNGDLGCPTLFGATATTTTGATTSAPVDTLQAAFLIAQNPGFNTTNLLALASATAPFQPIDSAVNDFTIGFAVQPSSIYGTALGTSAYIAFDSFGNAWVTNTDVTVTTGAPTYNATKTQFLTEFDPQGNLIGAPMYQYNTGTTAAPTIVTMGASISGNGSSKNLPFEVYLDPANNAWTTDPGNTTTAGAIVRIPGSSSAGGANGYNAGAGALAIPTAINTKPAGLAIDGNGNVYVSFLGSSTYNATFGTSQTGEGIIVPSGTTAGPLGGGTMLPDNLAATTTGVYLVVDNTTTATNAGAPFLDVITQATCGTTGIGLIPQYNLGGAAGTIDTLSANSAISDSATYATCTANNAKKNLPDLSVMYNSTTNMLGSGTTYAIPSIYTPQSAAVDASDNLWVLNVGYPATLGGYPLNSITKISPSYLTTPGTFTATAVNGGGLRYATTPLVIAIDGLGNAWTTGQQTGTAGTGASLYSGGAVSSHMEWNNAGTPLSPSALTTLKTSTVVTGWFGGNANAGTSNGGLTVASGQERSGQTRRGIAFDLSGNVWTTDNGSQGKTLFILVGAAGPVQTPLSLALKNGTVGTRP